MTTAPQNDVNCATGFLDAGATLAIGPVAPAQVHIEWLPGGFLLTISGPGTPFLRQIVPTAEGLVEFIKGWAAPR